MRAIAIGFVAAAALVTGAVVLWMVFFAGVPGSGSGGLGAVSAGVSDAIIAIALAASVVANRLFARGARARSGIARRVHQAHSVALVLLLLTIGTMFGSGNANPHSGLWFVLIAMLLFVLQFVLMGILLVLFAFTARPASAS
jgi:hypothetical protein